MLAPAMAPAAALAVAVALAPAAALASKPCACPSPVRSPPAGAEGVPTNVRVLGPGDDGGAASIHFLRNPAGGSPEDVPFRVEEASGGQRWIIPDAELDPNTDYRVTAPGLDVPFRTGAGPDTAAPTFDSLVVQGGALGGACEDHLGAQVIAGALSDDITPRFDLVMEVEVSSPPRKFMLPASFPAFGRIIEDEPQFSQCLDQYPDAEGEVVYAATVTVLDWAGNVSAPGSSEFSFEEGGLGGCQCHVTGGPAPGRVGLGAALFAAGILACAARAASRGARR